MFSSCASSEGTNIESIVSIVARIIRASPGGSPEGSGGGVGGGPSVAGACLALWVVRHS